ncbi:MAG: hypothetical protein LBL21_00620 [Rickettsiales bacterium]|nr:hypothetical protein [Rickettsiales bacterium]
MKKLFIFLCVIISAACHAGSDGPTVVFNCGDWELSVYKNDASLDYINVKDCKWNTGMQCREYELHKIPKNDSPETILVSKEWDEAEKMLILKKIWSDQHGGWASYSNESEKPKVWNNGTKWLLDNHMCEGAGIHEVE